MQNSIINLKQAAELIGYAPSTLWEFAKAGEFPYHQRGPGCKILINQDALLAWWKRYTSPEARAKRAFKRKV